MMPPTLAHHNNALVGHYDEQESAAAGGHLFWDCRLESGSVYDVSAAALREAIQDYPKFVKKCRSLSACNTGPAEE
jgi:hypothetical protein